MLHIWTDDRSEWEADYKVDGFIGVTLRRGRNAMRNSAALSTPQSINMNDALNGDPLKEMYSIRKESIRFK